MGIGRGGVEGVSGDVVDGLSGFPPKLICRENIWLQMGD